ncbi:MAG: hypothetical protein CM15mP49_35720 [Actinomycetota bacterium]|nr:MAG: hypothetical protein CM15mP49_35720 [Actinomycetota bacterium]
MDLWLPPLKIVLVDPTDPNIGNVVSQTPAAGESVDPGTTITIA